MCGINIYGISHHIRHKEIIFDTHMEYIYIERYFCNNQYFTNYFIELINLAVDLFLYGSIFNWNNRNHPLLFKRLFLCNRYFFANANH